MDPVGGPGRLPWGIVAHSPLTPVFTALRWGLHALLVGLLALVVRAALQDGDRGLAVGALALAFAGLYAQGGRVAALPDPRRRRRAAALWLAGLVLGWVVLTLAQADGVYLVFPLFFLVLHLLPGAGGPVLVAALTAVAVAAIGLRSGWSTGGVVGPVVGASVAVLVGLGYRALAVESAERERLLAELTSTRDALVAAEREQAVLAERSRLARDIHDTVAQSLSSIQLLLHAAERADPARPGVEHVRLARETAAASLLDTRGLIRELAPPDLAGERGLAGALDRLARTQWRPAGLAVTIDVPDPLEETMEVSAALLRIAQGAMSNVVRHADAREASVIVRRGPDRLSLVVTDDGRGFDPLDPAPAPGSSARESFGLRAIRERAEGLGGTLTVTSAPGQGCELRVDVVRSVLGQAPEPGAPDRRRRPGPAETTTALTPARPPAVTKEAP